MFIFSILIILFPFYNYPLFYNTRITPGGISLIKLVGIVAVLNALFYLPRSNNLRSRAFSGIFLCLFGFLIWAILNSYIFRDIGNPVPFQSLVAIIIFLITFVILIDSKDRAKKVIYLYVFGMVLACYRTYHELMIFLPMDPSYRPRSTFGDPNYFSLAMIPAICFTIGMITEVFEQKKRRKGFLLFILLIYLLVAFFYAASRGGTIGLFISIFLIFLGAKRKKMIIFVSIIIMIVFMPLLADRLIERFKSFIPNETVEITGDYESNAIRKMLLQGGIILIKRNIGFGIGAGNFKQSVAEVMPGIRDEGFLAHNTYIEVFAEHGIVGFLLFLVIIAWITLNINRTKFFQQRFRGGLIDPLVVSLYAGMIGYLIASLFLSVQYDRMFYLNIAIAIISLKGFPAREESALSPSPSI